MITDRRATLVDINFAQKNQDFDVLSKTYPIFMFLSFSLSLNIDDVEVRPAVQTLHFLAN